MSMDTCKGCCRYVDTDFDTDCYALYDENGNTIKELEYCLCENCRQKEEEIIIGAREGCNTGEASNGQQPDSETDRARDQ